jgi:hypothetical protein
VRATPDMSKGRIRPLRPCLVMVGTCVSDDMCVILACCALESAQPAKIGSW